MFLDKNYKVYHYRYWHDMCGTCLDIPGTCTCTCLDSRHAGSWKMRPVSTFYVQLNRSLDDNLDDNVLLRPAWILHVLLHFTITIQRGQSCTVKLFVVKILPNIFHSTKRLGLLRSHLLSSRSLLWHLNIQCNATPHHWPPLAPLCISCSLTLDSSSLFITTVLISMQEFVTQFHQTIVLVMSCFCCLCFLRLFVVHPHWFAGNTSSIRDGIQSSWCHLMRIVVHGQG